MKKKTVALLMAFVLVFGCAVGGTLAWLTDNSGPVTNTFTTSDVDITLAETKGNSFKMIPGHTIEKDPTVTVSDGSEDCWLFVKIEKSSNFDDFMTFTVADGWTALTGVDGVYSRKVMATDTTKSFAVLKDNKVAVKDTVTKTMMDRLTANTYPTLTVTAYACQLYRTNGTEFTAAEAWNVLNPTPSPSPSTNP